jgi:hypothetical protein
MTGFVNIFSCNIRHINDTPCAKHQHQLIPETYHNEKAGNQPASSIANDDKQLFKFRIGKLFAHSIY